MHLRVQFPILGEKSIQGLELIDTPGPDETGFSSIASTINNIISESGVIIYLLNYTSIGRQADTDMLNVLLDIQVGKIFNPKSCCLYLDDLN
jgi:predicted GTPase